MTIYRIQAPNGDILRIEGPEGASQEEILAFAESTWQPPAPKEDAIDKDVRRFQEAKQAKAKADATDRTWGEFAGDTARAVTQGSIDATAGLGGFLYGLATGDHDNASSRFARGMNEVIQEGKSKKARLEGEAVQKSVDAADGFWEKAAVGGWETLQNPTMLLDQVARSAPGMYAGGLAGRGATAATTRVGDALIGRAATMASPAATVGLAATKVAPKLAGPVAEATAALTQGSSVAGETYEDAMKVPLEVYAQQEGFAELANEVGAEEAKRIMASDATTRAGIMGTLASAASMRAIPGGNAIERMFLPKALREAGEAASTSLLTKPLTKGFSGGAASKAGELLVRGSVTGAAEGLSEGIEEGSGAVAKALEVSRLTGEVPDLNEVFAEAAGQAAPVGFLMGKVSGMRSNSEEEAPPPAPEAPKVEDMPTTPQAPSARAPQAQQAPTVSGDPLAAIDQESLLAATPVEGQEETPRVEVPEVQQPAQSAAAADEGAGVSQPTPVAPMQEPTVAEAATTPGIELPQATTTGQTPTVKFDESVAPKAPQQEATTANAVQEPATTQRQSVVPKPTQANDIIKTAIDTAKSHADLADTAMYTPEVLQRIADNPQAGPELKAAVARETARRVQVEQTKQDKIEAGRGEPMTVRDEPAPRPLSVERGLELAHTSRSRALLPQEQGYLTALKSEIGDNAFDLVMRSGAQPFRVNATERKFDLPRLVQSNQEQLAQWDQANNPEALAQPKFTPAPQSAPKTQAPAPAYQAWMPLPTMSLPARNLQANMGAQNGQSTTSASSTGLDSATRPLGAGAQPTVGGGRPDAVTQTASPAGGGVVTATKAGSATPVGPLQLTLAPAADKATLLQNQLTVKRKTGVVIQPVEEDHPLTEEQQIVSHLLNLKGKTVTWVERSSGPATEMPDGWVNQLGGKHIFLDVNSAKPLLTIAFHEGTHGLPAHIRTKLRDFVVARVSAEGRAKFLKQYSYDTLDQGRQDEEVLAYVSEGITKKPEFLNDLKTALGNKDFAAFVGHVLTKFKELMSGKAANTFDSTFLDKHVRDVAEIHKRLVDAYAQAMREEGLQPDAAVVEGPVLATKQQAEGEEADDSRAEITQKDIPESVDAPATLESALKLAGSKVWNKGRDLKVAMQNAVQEAAKAAGVDVGTPSDATTKYLTRVGVKDALGALKQNANAVGWYDLKTRQALSVMALVHPELARDENARFAMVWAMAVTSNGLKVDKNFEIAEKVYQAYKETGEMPTRMGIGQAAGAINESLKLFNELKAKWGIDNLRQFMLTNFTVKEITGIAKELKPGGEHADVVVRGAAILGPKIGNGFFSNLYGNFDALTMDRWLIRTWGRWTGTLISPMEKQTAKAKDRLAANLAEITKDPAEAARLGEAIGLDIRVDTPLDTLAAAVQKASMDPATRKEMNATAVGEELRKAGNGLAKYLDGQKEAPAGPTERKYIRKVFGEILSQLHQDPAYKDLSMADLQAVLWYAEKRLYESSKDDPSEDEVEGYADNEAPDYAVAASDVARKAGVTERRIQNALEKEKQNGRTTDARRADGSTEADRFGLKVSTGGFTDEERKSFVEWQALKRIGDSRLGGKELSWAYEGGSTGDGGRVRRLADLGVTYVAEWKLGKKAKTVFKANGLTAISMFELAPGDATNAQKFADAITASKNSTRFGAAVYVYPTKSSEDETGYTDMRLFLSKDGKNGVAVKRDGDIVSVFAEQRSGNSLSLLQVALAAGGRKLDAFDTVLPRIYSRHGFRAVARTEWNDAFAPEGWDKETFKRYNGGEPDVVFMAYDPAHGEMYETSDGKTYDDYDKAVAAQKRAVNKVAKDVPSSGPFFARKAEPDLDQDIVLEIPVEGGGTAKLTVNAKTYLEQLDRRQEALEMVKECML